MAYLDENGLEHFWGKIKDHVDSAVAPKADDADVVHKTGDETVQGEKVFKNEKVYSTSGSHVSNISIRNPAVERGTATSLEGNKRAYSSLFFLDNEGSDECPYTGRLAMMEYCAPSINDLQEYFSFRCYDYFSENGADNVALRLGYDTDRIPYATAPETSDDRTNSTDIVTRGYMEASEWNWQKTKKDALVQFKSAPESDLEPVVDFMFTETPPAEGEKGSENPSIISGVSSVNVTRCGKNLLPFPYSYGSRTISGVTFTVNEDGSVLVNGTSTERVVFYLNAIIQKTIFFPDTDYILHGKKSDAAGNNLVLGLDLFSFGEAPEYKRTISVGDETSASFTVDTRMYGRQYIAIASGITVQNILFYPQLEASSSKSDYEKPVYDQYTIQLGDTYYGGSLDVATGVMTVTEGKLTLDSSVNFVSRSGFFFENANTYVCSLYPANAPAYTLAYSVPSSYASNKLPVVYAYNPSTPAIGLVANSPVIRVSLAKSALGLGDGQSFAMVSAAMKTWLGSNPIEFFYPLATPSTVQLTPTQIRSLPALDKYEPRVNTVYTDQEAVQVGYQRYANYVDLTTDQTISGVKTFHSGLARVEGGTLAQFHLQLIGSSPDYQDIRFYVGDSLVSGSLLRSNIRSSSTDFSIGHYYAGDTSWASGAMLVFSATSGSFSLSAKQPGVTRKELIGTPSGTLSWYGQTVQTTSDERLKTPISEVPDAVLDAWEDVNWGQFQYLDAVAEKGESARLHLGLIAQHVMAVFEKHELDACDYGILCHEERPAVDEEHTVVDAEAYVDEEGVEHPAVTHVETRHEDAVDLWMVRYAEAQAMEACCMRRENARLKKRVADLEERLAALELKIS